MSPEPLTTCEYRCKWSVSQSDYNISDAVLFHLHNNLRVKDFVLGDLPTRHSLDQKWILMIREPPAFFLPQQLKLLNNKFNLTMTFQSDSDVSIPYGHYWNRDTVLEQLPEKYIKRKKMLLWLASNCITSSRREKYVEELSKHMPVVIRGRCGKPVRVEKNTYIEEFLLHIGPNFKFYLAFENSDCDEYITEKLWRSLMAGMIPIVRGQRAKYEKFAPPNSYIHTDSFSSPKELAQYLKRIAEDPTSFYRYHKWRLFYDAKYQKITANRFWMCDLCKQVHTSPTKTVDVYKHFSEDTRCLAYLDDNVRNRTGENIEDITAKL